MKTIGFYNQKGGCGKSTSVFQVAGFLAKAKKKVLVVDADVQSNVSSSLLSDSSSLDDENSLSFCDVALGLADIKDVIQNAPIEIRAGRKPQDVGIDILPSNKVKEVRHYTEDPYAVKKALSEVSDRYDYCLIDFPRKDRLTTWWVIQRHTIWSSCALSQLTILSCPVLLIWTRLMDLSM